MSKKSTTTAPAKAPAPEAPAAPASVPPASVAPAPADGAPLAEDFTAFKAQVAKSYHALVKAKTLAGLSRPDAVEVTKRQLDYDFAGAPAEIRALVTEALAEAGK